MKKESRRRKNDKKTDLEGWNKGFFPVCSGGMECVYR